MMPVEFVQPGNLQQLRQQHPELLMIDVRDRQAWECQCLADSVCVPLMQLCHGYRAPYTADNRQPVLLICQAGRRATKAAHALEQQLENPLFVLEGGLSACAAAGIELLAETH